MSNDYGVGYTTNTNKEFYFDLEDYDLIKEYKIICLCRKIRGCFLFNSF